MNFTISFYSYKPRVSFHLNLDSDTLPVVGDIININKKELSNISEKRKKHIPRDLEFKVIKRTFGKFGFINNNQYNWLIEVDFNDNLLHEIDKHLSLDKP